MKGYKNFEIVYTIGLFAVNVFILVGIIYIGIKVYQYRKKSK
ncbi:Uncharacterised protein [Listeria grayi]|nr:hypothetical protein [Listeria grayi]VEI33565.1 Uncharacterised protein [Listeria grayi]